MADHTDEHDHHDDWFRHTAAEGRPQPEHAAHVNSTAIGLTLLAVIFGVLFTVIVLSLYFVNYTTQLKAERQEGTFASEEYMTYREQSRRGLDRFGWADREAGTVNIPVERAMRDVVAYYGDGQGASRAAGSAPSVAMGGDTETDE